jgi:1,4-alpha-glucan branching enzyme
MAVEFSLFAPYNEEAALIIDARDWEPVPMRKDERGVFRVALELADGSYRYKFRVRSKSDFFDADQWVTVTDPRATETENNSDENGIVHIKNGQRFLDDYQWQADDQYLPSNEKLVIYELHVGDFSGGEAASDARGKFCHVLEKLDYLTDLGVNAIQFLPLADHPGTFSWGYNPRHFFAVEGNYGSRTDLKKLIDACHQRGIRVLLDMVFNHGEAETPLTQIDYTYWFYKDVQDADNHWGPQFDYDKYDEHLDYFPARAFFYDALGYWVSNFHLDGVRLDAIKQIGHPEVVAWVINNAEHIVMPKPFLSVAEHIPENPDWVGDNAPVESTWHESFYHAMLGLMQGKPDLKAIKRALDARERGFYRATDLVNYLSNHDKDHVMVSLGAVELLGDVAFERLKLGTALLFTAIGIPQIWMGQEFAERKSKRLDESKIEWGLLEYERNRDLFNFYKRFIRLRKTNGALQSSNLTWLEQAHASLLAFRRWDDIGSEVVVALNTAADALEFCFNALDDWHEMVTDQPVSNRQGDNICYLLGAYSVRVFVKK